jgi:hypothetical protein
MPEIGSTANKFNVILHQKSPKEPNHEFKKLKGKKLTEALHKRLSNEKYDKIKNDIEDHNDLKDVSNDKRLETLLSDISTKISDISNQKEFQQGSSDFQDLIKKYLKEVGAKSITFEKNGQVFTIYRKKSLLRTLKKCFSNIIKGKRFTNSEYISSNIKSGYFDKSEAQGFRPATSSRSDDKFHTIRKSSNVKGNVEEGNNKKNIDFCFNGGLNFLRELNADLQREKNVQSESDQEVLEETFNPLSENPEAGPSRQSTENLEVGQF